MGQVTETGGSGSCRIRVNASAFANVLMPQAASELARSGLPQQESRCMISSRSPARAPRRFSEVGQYFPVGPREPAR